MREIPLSHDKVVYVDDQDFEWLSISKWRLHSQGYAVTGKCILMHREIMSRHRPLFPKHVHVDHIDGNKLNNSYLNLRNSSKSTNGCNRGKQRNNKSGYKGVVLHQGLWRVEISFASKRIRKSGFKSPKEAALFYNKKAIEMHGEFARLNPIE